MFEENVKTFVNNIISIYNQIIDTLYRPAYSTNPEAFRLKNSSNIKIYLIKLAPLLGVNKELQLYLVHEKDANLEYQIIDLTDEKLYEDYSKYGTIQNFIKQKIIIKKGIFEESEIIHTHNISFLKEELNTLSIDEFKEYIYNEKWHKIFYDRMLDLVGREGQSYVEHVNHPASYYAKDATKYSYSLLDLKAIIDTVNDEDFSYQMDQAIAAYENSLYLASCATLGVCLETLCKLLLQKKGEKVKDSDATMLDKLGQRLREKKIINYKLNSRIDVCYKVRNLSSHTSPGKVLQGDCHFIIATINEIVDTYFK
ncbi:hypothetical protein [Bacillus halotolerans]|uniref:hypothetical protein n=1 Tax=Bacillus halotolerans TaxID=260554 RepID=UPI002232CA22|nr:hypothetical protein [Bacillus halotolerans]UZD52642.1 hypothetical protein OMK57_06400 [Bacillus halotolerans]